MRHGCTQRLSLHRVQKEETGIIKRKVKSALDTLANAAITTTVEQRDTEVAASTKHPRHRAGCSCIVCSQPPSGKGKHKPSCTCTVCEAVKRRFKTLMLRKRNREEAGQASQQALSR
ncbi:hypothetical protein Bca52824_089458 [Brassica carinata]|uniref:Uncharacterized protein n=1 Tax=Brassica carinata TaxID=52824 RepID=A0A8X7PEL8_BRACI|nr:hypothetical protein Bca52824_089458 [Brassica carinata]